MTHSRAAACWGMPRFFHVAPRAGVLWALCCLGGCSWQRSGASSDGGQAASRVELPIPVAVLPAEVGPIASYYVAPATLEVEREAEILSRVSGVVEAMLAEEGDLVPQSGRLLRLEGTEYRLRLKQAEARARDLRSKLARLETMENDLISIEEFETAKNDLANAEAELELARLNLSYTEVTAPFAGRVVQRMLDLGQYVDVKTPLFKLADFNPLLARVKVPAKEFRRIRVDQPVELLLDSNQERLAGRITLISPTIDPATGTIKVTVEIPDYPEGTRPGDFVKVFIVTERRPESTLVPRQAIVTENGEQVVFVAIDDRAERRIVEVGFIDDENAEIITGVSPNDQVVIKGQRSLKHGALLKVIAENPSPAHQTAALGNRSA